MFVSKIGLFKKIILCSKLRVRLNENNFHKPSFLFGILDVKRANALKKIYYTRKVFKCFDLGQKVTIIK